MIQCLDIHTHHLDAGADAIVSLDHDADVPAAGRYSIGVHPWRTDEPVDFDALAAKAALPQVEAIGEAGLDALRGASLPKQEEIFIRQAAISEAVSKPMVLHVVRAFDRMLRLRKQLHPTQPWIVHGFRGKPQLARQLLDAGFDISLGEHFNAEVAAMVPDHRLYAETDTSALSIEEIREKIGHFRKKP